ncbi:MAG: prolyl oligopeptidase family serine peptidase [Crocinitomicaceae bacterium]|nr:prolyl oligopeptidase family serine peptidase [Crocinitomicaceae bacterium]
MKWSLSLIFVSFFFQTFAQKKQLDHTVYDDWKSLNSSNLSKDGNFVSYEINPHRGDGYLYLYNYETAVLDSFFRGDGGRFSENNDFFYFKKKPEFDTLRKLELDKVDKKEWPKDSLFVVRLADMDVKSFQILKESKTQPNGNWLAYSIDSTYTEPKKEEKEDEFFKRFFSKFKKKKEETKEPKISSDGQVLYLFQPSTEQRQQFNDVTSFQFSDNGDYLIYVEHKKIDKENKYSLHGYTMSNGNRFVIDTAKTGLSNISVSKNDKFLAYLASTDTAKVKNSTFELFDLKGLKKFISLDSTSSFIANGKTVSKNQTFVFTENEKYMFLGIADASYEEPKDTLLGSEKAKLDVWHYADKRNQPMQLVELGRDKKASELHVLHLDNFELIRIEDENVTARPNKNISGDYIFATDDTPYELEYNWNFPFASNHYRISLIDGSRKLLKEGVVMSGEISPSGKYYTYFNDTQAQHYVVDIEANTGTCLTCGTKDVNWQVDGNGSPHVDYPLGIIGWDRAEEKMFVQSEFDVWQFDMNTRALTSITNQEGKENKIEFRIRKWEFDSVFIYPETIYLQGTDMVSKDEMIYEWIEHDDHNDIVKLYQTPHAINQVQKSEEGKQILIRKSNVTDYADAFIVDENFENERRISNTNPQQSEYNWATVELMDYKSYDGQNLRALLYKPEDFDSTKEYPMLVYFYELYTDRLHSHYAPKPTASIIFPTEYASAGYVVLIPDIRYKTGHPAQSAYDCIMASTDAALKKYPNIDEKRMGLQGQSWGGYQTAQLVTMTTRYKAAMAGAPVSNMFSAYGGIRWGSGMNRQFQYERTQSRIGKTIWEAPALYVENSPLFGLPNVQTPLLIMHNDGDGAVPWYQGIELFMGMKRLGKPVWMLNYNDDNHNLMKNANRIDLSIRMRQFFDYYLLDAKAPKWLIEGVPAIDKGKDYGLDLMEE